MTQIQDIRTHCKQFSLIISKDLRVTRMTQLILRLASGSWHWSIKVKVTGWRKGHSSKGSYSPLHIHRKMDRNFPRAEDSDKLFIDTNTYLIVQEEYFLKSVKKYQTVLPKNAYVRVCVELREWPTGTFQFILAV